MSESKRMKFRKISLRAILSDDLTEDLPLVNVFTAKIKDPKSISKVVLSLNSVLPIPELTHLKRVKQKEVLLLPESHCKLEEVLPNLKDKGFDTALIENEVRVVPVAKIPPKVKRQYGEIRKFWPCNFHPNQYLEKLSTNTLFSEEELEEHAKFLRAAFTVSEISKKRSAVIVDPNLGTIVGFGYDLSTQYPTKHPVMVAIDEVARTQSGGVWEPPPDYSKIRKHLEEEYHFGYSTTEAGPYLCTGYSVYATHEPCVTCAMALVHSRAKRVFYSSSSVDGGLGTLCKIHTVENLNHHYEVFAGLLEDECLL